MTPGRYHQLRFYDKRFVTAGYVTNSYALGVARDRSDTRWSQAQEPWQRLRWARETHGSYSTPTAFARAAKMQPHTYAAYERDPDTASKAIGSHHKHAASWADLLDVDYYWLRDGSGVPWKEQSETIDVSGLQPTQIDLVRSMVDQLRKAG